VAPAVGGTGTVQRARVRFLLLADAQLQHRHVHFAQKPTRDVKWLAGAGRSGNVGIRDLSLMGSRWTGAVWRRRQLQDSEGA
jgi:hypothetical protein